MIMNNVQVLTVFRYFQKEKDFYSPIKDCLDLLDIKCKRADAGDNSKEENNSTIRYEILKPQKSSLSDMKEKITLSPFIIADISHNDIKKVFGNRVVRRPFNENVFFEIGYASALNKEILLFKDITKGCIGRNIPFDVREYTIIGFQKENLRGYELAILICSWIKNNANLNIHTSNRFTMPDSTWKGSFFISDYFDKVKIYEHRIVMELFDDESILCTINVFVDGKEYCIKEICKFEYNRDGQKYYKGMAFYNVNEENRLDYWLDGFLIKKEDNILNVQVFDSMNTRKTPFVLQKVQRHSST